MATTWKALQEFADGKRPVYYVEDGEVQECFVDDFVSRAADAQFAVRKVTLNPAVVERLADAERRARLSRS